MSYLSRLRFWTIAGCSTVLTLLFSPLVLAQQSAESSVGGTTSINVFQAIVLGFVQGVTEFLPISSTAHLKVIPVALGWGDPGVTFTAIIQLGSIAAVLWYFWGDLTQVTVGAWQALRRKDYAAQDFQMALGIGLGTVPIVFFGLLIKRFIPDFDHSPIRSLGAIAIASIVMSLLLGLAEKIGSRKRDYAAITLHDGLWMGVAQALALVPGVSRSGSTLTAGLLIGLQRASAARFSFLLGIPAITLAGLLELKDALAASPNSSEMVALAIGTLSSAIFSYLAIAWLLKFLQTQSTWIFIWYRLAFGIAVLTALFFQVIPNR